MILHIVFWNIRRESMEKDLEKLIEKATFSEIYDIVKNRKNKDLLKCFCGIFKIGLLFLPELLFPELEPLVNLSNGVNLIGAADAIGVAINGVHKYFKNRKYTDYKTRYNDMQIAHYLIVYSAFFDAIKEYLPDEEGKIALMGNEKVFITKEAIKNYQKGLNYNRNKENDKWIDDVVSIPDLLCTFNSYLDHLKVFYKKYSFEFMKFFTKLECWENMKEEQKDCVVSVIDKLPEYAIENYKMQYYELARCFSDFEIWINLRERQCVENVIDVGFNSLSKKISNLIENSETKMVVDILERFHNEYEEYISKSIVTGETDNSTENQVFLPTKSKIFVPQQFQAIKYDKKIKLEPKETWKNAVKQDNIGAFISGVLRHPDSNTKPLVILGSPGAGKSLLCNMLAAKLLYQEYHVIIVTLRDARADDTIVQQISDQIKGEFGDCCSWYHISKAKLDKPMLIIFDGYDELLQSSGKPYSYYINKIADFQQLQLNTCAMQVKCIITSRITLIDKAYIPNGSVILKLCDFNKQRIDKWIDIWNSHNVNYFEENGLKEFSIPDNGKIVELARQPLLLMMLALYDSNDNKLDRQKNLTQTQLYDDLIRDFVAREKRKDENFRNLAYDEQDKIIEEEVIKIGIVAIGMYNRNIYHIISEDLNADIKFYENTCTLIEPAISTNDGITEAEKLLASFFFMHKSVSTDYQNEKKKAAYEFLHNTFGEFLTANFILNNVYSVIDEIHFLNKNNRQLRWNDILSDVWYSSLIYTPLFSKPVVVSMLKEWSTIFIKEKKLSKSDVKVTLDLILNYELVKVINGEIFNNISSIINKRENVYPNNDLLIHVANYSINLLILRNVLEKDIVGIELLPPLNQNTLNNLIHIWRYAFSDEQLQRLSHLFIISKDEIENKNVIIINYTLNSNDFDNSESKLNTIYDISYSIGDELIYGLSGCLIGDYRYEVEVINAIKNCSLKITSNYYLTTIINSLLNDGNCNLLIKNLMKFIDSSISEKNLQFLYFSCILLEYFLNNILDLRNSIEYMWFDIILKKMCDFYFMQKRNADNFDIFKIEKYIFRILLNNKISDEYFLKLTSEINLIESGVIDFVNLDVLKCVNKFINIISKQKDVETKYISKIEDLISLITKEESDLLRNRKFSNLYIIEELFEINISLISLDFSWGIEFFKIYLEKNFSLEFLQKKADSPFDKDTIVFSKICYNCAVLLSFNLEFNIKNKYYVYQHDSDTMPILTNILYCIRICNLNFFSDAMMNNMLQILNRYNFNEHDIHYFELDKQLSNYINDKNGNFSTKVASQIIKFAKKYSCDDLIEKIKSLFD